jgi:hypothetical protein
MSYLAVQKEYVTKGHYLTVVCHISYVFSYMEFSLEPIIYGIKLSKELFFSFKLIATSGTQVDIVRGSTVSFHEIENVEIT